MTEIVRNTPTEATCVDQLLADMATLSADQIQDFLKGMELEEGLPPHLAIRKHLEEHPARVPQLASLIVMRTSYASVLEPLEVMDGDLYFKRHAKDFIECLGSVRTYVCMAAILYRVGGDKLAKVRYHPEKGVAGEIDDFPDTDKVKSLAKRMKDDLVTVHSVQIRDASLTMKEAMERAAKAEKELKDAKLKWTKVQERMASEAQRSKAKAAAEAVGAADKSAQSTLSELQKKLEDEKAAHRKTADSLKEAHNKLDEIDQEGGATPERVEEIRAEIKREAEQRVEDELSIAVRPWLVRLNEMEKSQVKLKAMQALSAQALDRAKKEAASNDFLINWELDRERALKALEAEMTELDNLMLRVIKPTPELCSMHSDLLEAMLACRKQLNPSKPLGEVAKALIAGLKKVKDEELGEAAYAVKKLAEKGVFLGLEAETLLKIVETEKQARYDASHFKQSVQGQMIQRLHSGKQVDILIDGYNFMFTANQYFGDKLKLSRNADGEAVFGEAGRSKLVKLLVPMANKFPCLDIDIFFDGLVKEERQPHPRVKMWQPTFQRAGKGQADAEIANVGLKRVRPDALAVVVSNDKVVQRYAKHFLSVRLFSDFIANH